ncbi:hypothetical protein GCM10010236_51380 [Streptomyces eurythermus]|nr:hypothetical protein GCM10010236_51380 [Streptomyces eurythermus]
MGAAVVGAVEVAGSVGVVTVASGVPGAAVGRGRWVMGRATTGRVLGRTAGRACAVRASAGDVTGADDDGVDVTGVDDDGADGGGVVVTGSVVRGAVVCPAAASTPLRW